MRNILLINNKSSSLQGFTKSLSKKGYSLIASDNLKKSIPIIKKGDIELIVVDKGFSSDKTNFSKFKKLTASIPKIILTGANTLRGMNVWLKNEIAAPLCEPFSYSDF